MRRRKQSPVPHEVQRAFRNAQRSVVRDIAMTQREYQKAIGTNAGDFLARRLVSLEKLRHAMLGSYKDEDGHRFYNVASGRMDAYETYLRDFKGKPRLEEQRTTYKALRLAAGNEQFAKNAAAKYGYDKSIEDTPFSETALYQELMDELDQAVLEYDSEGARKAYAKMMHGAEAYRTFRQNH